jgi:hypothetical protein
MTERSPNPFETAIRQHGVMHVVLKADDLMRADSSMTRSDAEQLMSKLGPLLASEMIRTGVQLAIELRRQVMQ